MHFSILVASLSCVFQAAAVPHVFRRTPDHFTVRAQASSEIQQSLGPLLSPNATIYFPGGSQFTEATSRWSTYGEPNISVVVEVATAADVAATVQYANSVQMPFLAVNRGHGSSDTLAKVQNGIEIWLNQLDSIEVAEDGNSAVLGGGVYISPLISELAKYNKITASGACGCVGLMGAGLGGGHGRLQGFYGLIADNIIDVNLVLWNGTQVNVSATSHPDLYWALKGAGHNYGITTSLTYKIYDEPSPTWFYGTYYFTQDRLESMFEELNRQANATLPREMGYIYINYAWNTNISTTEPLVVLTINFAGDAEAVAPYTDPFKKLNPVSSEEGQVPYSQIAEASGTDVDDPVCSHGSNRLLFSADTFIYNVSTNRAVYELYKNMTVTHPEYQAGSLVLFESYSQQGVKAVPFDSTAYAHRARNVLFSLSISFVSPELTEPAIAWGNQTRSMVHAGQAPGTKLDVYVNYAFGDETLESLYGYEPWRLEKLRRLKREWDPQNKFNFFLGIS